MSIDDDTNKSKVDDNSNSYDDEKRVNQDSAESNQPDETGEIDLEEGEIEDDDNNNEVNQKSIKNHHAKKAHKRKRKHRSRKRHKETVIYDGDVYSYEYDQNKESPDKKLKSDLNENSNEFVQQPSKPNQPQSLLSLPLLINDENLLKKSSFFQTNNFNNQQMASSAENSNDKTDNTDEDSEKDSGEEEDDNDSDELTVDNQPAPNSLFDLFGNNQTFFDPTITEKENSKPTKQQQQQKLEQQQEVKKKKKVSKKQRLSLKKQQKETKDTGLSKKEIKKKKYLEQMKEKQKRELERKEKIAETICKFYLEGRCTKGDECPFSHNAQINKKLEICKYYLNGFCGKSNNCTFMHSEFPCKFYHTNKECKSGSSCRFSHEPMTEQIREAFIKYLKETDGDVQAVASINQRSSLLGSPPRFPSKEQEKLADNKKAMQQQTQSMSRGAGSIQPLVKQSITTSQVKSSIPSLMDLPVPLKPQQKPAPLMSSLKLDNFNETKKPSLPHDIDVKPSKQSLMSTLFSQDIDERCPPPPLQSQPTAVQMQPQLVTPVGDIDERSASLPQPNLLTNLLENNLDPIVKLLQHKPQQQRQQQPVEAQIPNLVTSLFSSSPFLPALLTAAVASTTPSNTSATLTTTMTSGLTQPNPTSSNENFFSALLKNLKNEPEESVNEPVEIDGRTNGEVPYKIVPIDVEQSSLWTNPPTQNPNNNSDSECDPRIEYYSNKLNNKHLNNDLKSLNLVNLNQPLFTPATSASALSPPHLSSYQTNTITTNEDIKPTLAQLQKNALKQEPLVPPLMGIKKDIRDPRLSSKQNQNFTTTEKPSITEAPSLNDLISLTTRSSSSNLSLLSSLPDFKFPTNDHKPIINSYQQQQHQQRSNTFDSNNTVRLSIADYKRKSQKPNNSTNYDDNEINSEIPKPNVLSYAPQIPSYSVTNITNPGDFKAPQSLHELLKNYPT